jgi:hypothetical protein
VSEQAGSRVFVVCSDEARNGKTLVSRLLMDHLLMTGFNPHVFDCDAPRGRIRRFYPDDSTLIDVEKTSGQIQLFDTILAQPQRDYVIDLPSHGLGTFFTVVEDLDFINAAHEVRVEFVIAFVLDQTAESVMIARDLRGAYSAETFYLFRNAWNGNPLVTRQGREVYEEIEPDTVFSLPLLDREAMAIAEDPPFSFVEFLDGEHTTIQPALRLRLRSFLSEVFGQFQRRDLSLDLGSLKKMGLI